MHSLFIFRTERDMRQAGFHPATRMHQDNRNVRAVFYDDKQLSRELDKLRDIHFDMIVLDPSCSPFQMTLVGSQFGEFRSFIEFITVCQGGRPTTWVGDFPAWRQE